MKKTFTINISNMVYHIDEDAYALLRTYLEKIEIALASEADKKEILEDIEARIAELFTERIKDFKEVITLIDVEKVISVLGDPSTFASDGEFSEPQEKTQRVYSTRRRIYRDPDNRIISGVSGGLGAYFNADPVIFRILFLVFAFTGAGFLVYVIMWIVIPEAKTTAQKLEMRGEPVTLENIKNFVKEEFANVKSKMKL
jgi:phage shock protein PspC (stress-responsive transcriptional regulator)